MVSSASTESFASDGNGLRVLGNGTRALLAFAGHDNLLPIHHDGLEHLAVTGINRDGHAFIFIQFDATN